MEIRLNKEVYWIYQIHTFADVDKSPRCRSYYLQDVPRQANEYDIKSLLAPIRLLRRISKCQ